MAIDPVCRMTVEPQQAAASVEYEGSTYYFCSRGCHQEFTAHPEKYATQKPDSDRSGHTRGHG